MTKTKTKKTKTKTKKTKTKTKKTKTKTKTTSTRKPFLNKKQRANMWKPISTLLRESQQNFLTSIYFDEDEIDEYFNMLHETVLKLFDCDFEGIKPLTICHIWCECPDFCDCPTTRSVKDEIDYLATCHDRHLPDEATQWLKEHPKVYYGL